MLRFFKFVYRASMLIGGALLLSLCIGVCMRAGEIEKAYFSKYEHIYNTMALEHDRQLVFGQVIRSQRAWEQAYMSLLGTYQDTKMENSALELKLEIEGHEFYVFLKALVKLHPGVMEEVFHHVGPDPLLPSVLQSVEE